MPEPFEVFFADLRDIHLSGAGVKETSFYGPLANLLNEIGHALKPKVRCIINLANQGAGIPDGGLFTPEYAQAPWSWGKFWDLMVHLPLPASVLAPAFTTFCVVTRKLPGPGLPAAFSRAACT